MRPAIIPPREPGSRTDVRGRAPQGSAYALGGGLEAEDPLEGRTALCHERETLRRRLVPHSAAGGPLFLRQLGQAEGGSCGSGWEGRWMGFEGPGNGAREGENAGKGKIGVRGDPK